MKIFGLIIRSAKEDAKIENELFSKNITLRETVDSYEELNKILYSKKEELKEIKNRLRGYSAKDVVKQMMKRDIRFFDVGRFGKAKLATYWSSAQSALNNEALNNEIKHLIFDQTQFCAGESENHNETEKSRWIMTAFQLLEDRLNDINNPNEPQEEVDEEDLNEAL